MKIVIVTQEEPFYIPLCLSEIIKAFSTEIAAIIALPGLPYGYNYLTYIKKLYDIFGLFDFIKYGFLFLQYKIYDYIDIKHNRFYSIKRAAQKNNIPFYAVKNINSTESYNLLNLLKPDYLVSIAAPQVFKKRIIDLAHHTVNIHGAKLPQYQGMMPGYWVLAKGEKNTGVTMHYIDENIDHGEIILQKEIEIAPNETFHSMQTKIALIGGLVIIEGIINLESGKHDLIQPDIQTQSYYSLPTKEAAKEFKKRGHKFL